MNRLQKDETGNLRVRKALYMPAVVAQRHNPILKEFRDRLIHEGKYQMVILGALIRTRHRSFAAVLEMSVRKLLHLVL